MAEEASTVWTDHILLVHSSIERHLGYVHILAMTTSAPLNMHTQVFAWVPVFNSLGSYPRVEWLGHTVVILCLIF